MASSINHRTWFVDPIIPSNIHCILFSHDIVEKRKCDPIYVARNLHILYFHTSIQMFLCILNEVECSQSKIYILVLQPKRLKYFVTDYTDAIEKEQSMQ